MPKNKKHLLILLLVTLTILLPYNLNKESKVINTITTVLKQKDNKPNKVKEIGILEIPKINLKRYLYDINSDLNKVDKNVTIIKETISNNENGTIVLAAHSGNNYNSYFDNLDKLKKDDIIYLKYKNINYQYIVTNIYEKKQNGYISIKNKNINQLFLTTCSKKKNYQLTIECQKK